MSIVLRQILLGAKIQFSAKRPLERFILEVQLDDLLSGIALRAGHLRELVLVLAGLLPKLSVFHLLCAVRVMHSVQLCDMLTSLVFQLR